MVNSKSRKVTLLSEMVYVYFIDGLKFVTKLLKHCSSFAEHEAAPTMLSIYHLYNIGIKCSL